MRNNITATDGAVAAILRARGVALDELPASIQARLIHQASEQFSRTNGAISLVDLESSLSDKPISGPAEANALYSRYVADINRKNREFWANGGRA